MDRETERGIEWDCQKTWRQYYLYVDHHEFEKAVTLFTEDITWKEMGLNLKGRDELLEALYGALGDDTIRHCLTNMVVNVIDEDHAEAASVQHALLLARRAARRHGRSAKVRGPAPVRR